MDLNLSGKNVLITGAAKGIGRGIALAVSKEGARIALHYHGSEDQAKQTVEMIQDQGGKVSLISGDLANLEEVERMKQQLDTEMGTLYGIVNNAGVALFKPFFEYRPAEWKREVDVCFYGVVHLVNTFMPDMMKKNEGKFINIVGDSARTGDRNLILSAAARGGAISFLKSLAGEVGKYKIQCNTVALGMIDQGLLTFDDATLQKIVKQYPLKRLGTIEDVTGISLFLLSSWSDWITGQTISVNGGYSMMG